MHLIDHTCPICGKNFVPAPLHAFRHQRDCVTVCSYTCFSKYLKETEKKNKIQKCIDKPKIV